MLTRQIELRADAAGDVEAIPCTIATNAPVPRSMVAEILDCTPAGVDLTRAPLPLLIAHDAGSLAVGHVDALAADGNRVTGRARFATSPEAQQILADVKAGIHRSLSVGYQHIGEGVPTDAGTVYRWQPHEVSIVPVPADVAAGFFRSLHDTNMNTTAPATTAPATTAPAINRAGLQAEIMELGKRHGLTDFARGLAQSATDIGAARTAIANELGARDLAAGGHINVSPMDYSGGRNEREVLIASLAHRMGARQKDQPILRGLDAVGLALRSLELAGERVYSDMSRTQIIERAMHGTGDFPNLLGAAAGRVLHDAYAAAPAALKAVARETLLPDFRDRTAVRLGSAPSLEKVNEHGEFHYGTIEEGAAVWRLATYGRIFSITRQALVNDDLGAFGDLVRMFAEAAARREADELVKALTSPGQVDGAALFSSARSTQTARKLTLAGLGVAVQALRSQKHFGELVAQEPGAIVVPAALEMTARQLVASISATKTSDVQPFGPLGVVVEPRLTDADGWYLVAVNQRALEYGYLDGEAGPQISQREGFEVDGLEVKARLDFGCGWVSPVGWVQNTGATGDV